MQGTQILAKSSKMTEICGTEVTFLDLTHFHYFYPYKKMVSFIDSPFKDVLPKITIYFRLLQIFISIVCQSQHLRASP